MDREAINQIRKNQKKEKQEKQTKFFLRQQLKLQLKGNKCKTTLNMFHFNLELTIKGIGDGFHHNFKEGMKVHNVRYQGVNLG